MTFEEILKSKELSLPFIQTQRQHFREFLFHLLDEYLRLLQTLDEGQIKIPNVNSSKRSLIKLQTTFVEGIKDAVNWYFDGHPSKAYQRLSETLNSRIRKYKNLLKVDKYEVNENFYRIRSINNNFPIKSTEFFHMPFDKRGKVSTQRYSIPGFPSLYLGRTIYICWEELNRPNFNDFQVVRIKNIKEITFLDLAPPYFEENLNTDEYYKYLTTWPLVAACSIKVKNGDDIFKPEYIVPQLLLQWVREIQEMDGIRYWSTHVDSNPTKFKGEFYNLVLPVKDNKDEGLCDKLTSKFEMTEALSWQMHQAALGGGTFMKGRDESNVDKKISRLEIIKGIKLPYSYSILGGLEEYLDNSLKTHPIKAG